MNETTKTAIYGGVALLAALLAAFSIPLERTSIVEIDDDRFARGLFPELESAEEVEGLRIVQSDDKGGPAKEFRVEQKQGRWVIASRDDYPADLKDQIKNAATALVGLKPQPQPATELESQHAQFGVVEPAKDKASTGDKDTGTLVELMNKKGNSVAKLIIGKPVKGSPNQRFVRLPGESRVYTAIISPERLSTKFEDWIEKDLLKLKAADVNRVVIKDYVPEIVANEEGAADRAVLRRSEITLKFDEKDWKWGLEKLILYRENRPVPGKLLENEEINGQRIDDMKTALADLKIVDVLPKPKPLAQSLRGQQVALDPESQMSLYKLGFPAFQDRASGEIKLLSVNGDVEVDTKEGVQYILRFGNIAGTQQGETSDKLNRYLMVSAQLDPTAFPPPQLKPVPELPATAEKPASGEKKDEPKKDDAKKDDGKKADAPAEKNTELEAERDRVIKENERATNEWKEKKLKAEQRVQELNDRFADWYFVVSEDGFKKVRFSLQDVVKEKEEGYLLDSFRKLEKEGMKKPKAEPGAGGPPGGFPGGFNIPM